MGKLLSSPFHSKCYLAALTVRWYWPGRGKISFPALQLSSSGCDPAMFTWVKSVVVFAVTGMEQTDGGRRLEDQPIQRREEAATAAPKT